MITFRRSIPHLMIAVSVGGLDGGLSCNVLHFRIVGGLCIWVCACDQGIHGAGGDTTRASKGSVKGGEPCRERHLCELWGPQLTLVQPEEAQGPGLGT